MKTVIAAAVLCMSAAAQAQTADAYLERIRGNSAQLTAFFSAMPKGGDLHHHYSGSVYTETYINRVVGNDYFINRKTFAVMKDTIAGQGEGCARFSALGDSLGYYKQQLVQRWSVKDYNGISYPSDKQFFETFDYFRVTSNDSLKAGLLELKHRAISENLSYIETMFTGISCKADVGDLKPYNTRLRDAQSQRDTTAVQQLLLELYLQLMGRDIQACALKHNAMVAQLHEEAKIDDERFTMRYQNYIVRLFDPVTVFKSLVTAFESANSSPLIVGVNIVAPENNEVSMADYWLHMQMYKFCHGKYPKVKYAMHAGELVLGMVQPEELTWHINDAVYTAGAKRIGHGADIAHEANSYSLLRHMAKKKIAIEINLVSNEFILKLKNDHHPLSLYRQFGVPVVISTDDAGVLRTNLTEQYVLLAKRYRDIPYSEIKQFVFNSIKYSFIKEAAVKEKLMADLKQRFEVFEQEIAAIEKN